MDAFGVNPDLAAGVASEHGAIVYHGYTFLLANQPLWPPQQPEMPPPTIIRS